MTTRSTVLDDATRDAWLGLITPYAEAKGMVKVWTTQPFAVCFGDMELVIPVNTELVFFHNVTGNYRGTRAPYRIEGVFYMNDALVSIRGYFGRKVPTGKEERYARKTAEYKVLASTPSTFDSARTPSWQMPVLV